MVIMPRTHGDYGYDGVHDQVWPPPSEKVPSEKAARLRELAELMNELTDRMDVAAKKEYVWPPSLINKFVLCLKADSRAREILTELLGGA